MTPLTRPAAPTPRRAAATYGAELTFETLDGSGRAAALHRATTRCCA